MKRKGGVLKDKELVARIYIAAVMAVLLIVVLHDATAHIFSTWRSGCDVEIFDVYGYMKNIPDKEGTCYYKGLDVWTFRNLGKTDADTIIIVSHFFTSPSAVGLGISDGQSPFFLLTHPISIFYIVKGTSDDASYLAVSPDIVSISSRLDGKTIVLITCNLPRMNELAEAFLNAGAKRVIVTNMERLADSYTNYMVSKVLEALETENVEDLCRTPLFTCYT
jgi:hypothetical protein